MGQTLAERETVVNSISQIHFISDSLSNGGMKTIDEIRRENLKALTKDTGGVKASAEKCDMTESQYSNLMHGAKDSKTGKPRGFNNTTARKIECAFGKERGWLDNVHNDEDLEKMREMMAEFRAWITKKGEISQQPTANHHNGTQ